MKIQCAREKIKNAVSFADRITNKNMSLPILGSILLSAEKNTLKIRATNLDLGIEIKIPTKTEKEGTVAVPGGVLNNFLSNITDENVSFDVKNDNLCIETKNNKALIKCYQSEDFPTLPVITQGSSFSIPSKKLIDGLRSVWYSASLSDIKPEIACVCMYTNGKDIVFAATDSFRLAEKKVLFDEKQEIPFLLIPYKNAIEIARVIEYAPENIEILYNKNQVVFKYESFYITSRLVDGIFPDYKQIIPKNFKTEVVVLKHDIINSLKITNLFSDKLNQVVFDVNPAKKTFEVTSKNPDVGENNTALYAALTGEPSRLQFNQKYIMDCFQSIPTESVALQMSGEGKPLVIKGVGDGSFTYLVMPLNQ